MYDLFVQSPEAAVVLGLSALAVIAIIAITGMVLWSKHLKVKSDAELKLNMLDRGMPVEEIERVLAAKSTATKPPALQFEFRKPQL
jgi:hypothetical protein